MMQSKLRKAVYKGDGKKIVNLVRKGANIDELDENDRTILLELTSHFIATEYNIPPELIRLLIELGANVNYTVKRRTAINYCHEFESPLANAVRSKKAGIVKVLLEKGADPNVYIDDGHPPHRTTGARVLSLVTPACDFDDEPTKEIRRLLKEHGARGLSE